jgi:hypothetical protein
MFERGSARLDVLEPERIRVSVGESGNAAANEIYDLAAALTRNNAAGFVSVKGLSETRFKVG